MIRAAFDVLRLEHLGEGALPLLRDEPVLAHPDKENTLPTGSIWNPSSKGKKNDQNFFLFLSLFLGKTPPRKYFTVRH